MFCNYSELKENLNKEIIDNHLLKCNIYVLKIKPGLNGETPKVVSIILAFAVIKIEKRELNYYYFHTI